MAERSTGGRDERSNDASADAGGPRFRYAGPKDVGRAESLFQSARSKPDPDYVAQLLFSALAANPEHAGALTAILARVPASAPKGGKRMVARISDLLSGAPADEFIKALAAYCAAPTADAALACAGEAQSAGLMPYAVALGERALQALEAKEWIPPRAAAIARLIELLEASGALPQAVRAAREAVRLFPDDQALRAREKNLLASRYMQETDLASAPAFQKTLTARAQQEALHRPTDHNSRLDGLEQRYRQTNGLEDFRELARALRDAYPARREAALPTLRDGLARFGDRDTRWFVREIELERKRAELRLHKQVLDETPASQRVAEEHRRLAAEVLAEQIEHLYEVVGSLPATPERHRRELELARTLLDAGRHEEAIKQAQTVKRNVEHRLDGWIVMARSFVQLGWIPEAGECFEQILAELKSGSHGSIDRVLEAKYTYAEFLLDEAAKRRDVELARQARKLCSDVMIEDIDYREIRRLATRAERMVEGRP
jgi:tetratricopeptide (TPR) repeat protein